jgi:small subunit ribosomal protein S16
MKKFGRLHRPFFRICATDTRSPRDGKVIEELGTYDPMVPDTDARAVFNAERVDYWLSVGAQPSERVKVLIRKYGTNGTHKSQQQTALANLAERKPVPPAPEPVVIVTKKQKGAPPPEEPAAEAAEAPEAAAEGPVEALAEAPPEAPAEPTAAE